MSEHHSPHHEHDEQHEDETMRDESMRDDSDRDEALHHEAARLEATDEETPDPTLQQPVLHDETLHDETGVPAADPVQPLIRYQEPQYGLSDEQVASVTAGQGTWPGAGPATGSSGYGVSYQGHDEQEPESRGGFHQVAVGHLVMGIAFIGLVVIWLLRVTDAVPTEDFRWLMPLPWIAAGGLGLLALALRSGRRDEAY